MEKEFSASELERYSRHIAMTDFGLEGQRKLAGGSVLVIGAGGLGSPVAYYLAAAGVGRIGIADGDCVDMSNLQRQILHGVADLGRPKAVSACEKLQALNPEIKIETIARFVDEDEMAELFSYYDFVIDATDSLKAKYAIDEGCRKAGKPYSHGAIFCYEGHTMTVLPGSSRLTDLFPDGMLTDTSGPTAGPLGVVAGILGCIQAAEAIKYITGIGELLTDRLLRFDLRTMRFSTLRL